MHGLLLFAIIAGGLVVDQRLADVVYPPAQNNPSPAVKACRPGCNCATDGCHCGKSIASACAEMLAHASIDESNLKTVAAQARDQTDAITIYSPEWCKGPCAWMKEQLGEGDSLTKVEYVAKEVWFELGPHESYPMLINMKTLKKWSQDPRPNAKDIRPKTMDEARAKLGIEPKAKGHVVGLTVGTLPREQVDLLREFLGESGRRKQGNKPLTREVPGGQAVIPSHSVTEWNTVGDVLTMNFDKRPRVIFGGILNQDLDRVVITDKTVTFELPWAPDATFRIE